MQNERLIKDYCEHFMAAKSAKRQENAVSKWI
jgi:uncharacterized membrane protein